MRDEGLERALEELGDGASARLILDDGSECGAVVRAGEFVEEETPGGSIGAVSGGYSLTPTSAAASDSAPR